MSPVAMAFIEAPYIAILPRILAAIGAFGVYKLITKLAKPSRRATRAVTVGVVSAVGSLLNTALVVGLFVLIMPNMSVVYGGDEMTMLVYAPIMLLSGLIEMVCMAVITPPISLTLDRFVLNRTHKRAKPQAQNESAPTPVAEPSEQSVDTDSQTATELKQSEE